MLRQIITFDGTSSVIRQQRPLWSPIGLGPGGTNVHSRGTLSGRQVNPGGRPGAGAGLGGLAVARLSGSGEPRRRIVGATLVVALWLGPVAGPGGLFGEISFDNRHITPYTATIPGLVSTAMVQYLVILLATRESWTEARGELRAVNALISAHRGNNGNPDLPIAERYKRAIDLNVDYVEFDVRKTKDGTLVIWHDEHTPSHRRVADLSFEEYQSEMGDQAMTVPQLLAMARGRVGLQFDLKETGYEDEVVELALSCLSPAEFVITSLEDVSVKTIKEKFPQQDFPALKVGLTLGRNLEGAGLFKKLHVRLSELFPGKRLRKSQADFVAVHHRLASVNVLRYCRRKRIPAWVWTVDDEPGMMRFLNNPTVTSLISNKPEIALSLRAKNA